MVDRTFELERAICCPMATEKLLWYPREKSWFHYDDRFDPIYYYPWCGAKLKELE